MTRYDKWLADKRYAAKLNLLAKIHRTIDPILIKSREAEEFLNNNRHENQNFVFDLGKYITEGHSMGKDTEPNLAFENDERFALLVRSQQLREKQVEEKLAEDFN